MSIVKKKVGRPAKKVDDRNWVEMLRTKEPTNDEKLAKLTSRVTKLERILEDAVNAGRELHKKMEGLSAIKNKNWVPRNGFDQPIGISGETVSVMLAGGEIVGPQHANFYYWGDCGERTIVAYKVH